MYIVYTLFSGFRSLQYSVMLSYPSTEFVGAKLCRFVYIQENLSVRIQINIFDCKIDFCSLNLCVCVYVCVCLFMLNHHFSTKLSSYAKCLFHTQHIILCSQNCGISVTPQFPQSSLTGLIWLFYYYCKFI